MRLLSLLVPPALVILLLLGWYIATTARAVAPPPSIGVNASWPVGAQQAGWTQRQASALAKAPVH